VIAFAFLVVGFIDALRDFGMKDALIYSSESVEETADTAFVMNVAIGLAQGLIVVLLAPLASLAIDDARAVDVLCVLALALPINALAITHEGLLQKAMEFRRCYAADLVGALAKTVVTIALVFGGFGIWSLVTGQLAGALCRTTGRWLLLDWRPRWRFLRERA